MVPEPFQGDVAGLLIEAERLGTEGEPYPAEGKISDPRFGPAVIAAQWRAFEKAFPVAAAMYPAPKPEDTAASLSRKREDADRVAAMIRQQVDGAMAEWKQWLAADRIDESGKDGPLPARSGSKYPPVSAREASLHQLGVMEQFDNPDVPWHRDDGLVSPPEFQTGMIVAYAAPWTYGSSYGPDGWLWCDGGEYSQTGEYAALFAVIGTTYGSGSEAGMFQVPNLLQKVIVGAEAGDPPAGFDPGQTGGFDVHGTTFNGHMDHATGRAEGETVQGIDVVIPPATHSDTNNYPPYLALRYIIKT